MADYDLLSMEKDELVALKKSVDKAILDFETRRKAEAKKAAEAVAREFGFALSEVMEFGGTKGSKGAPKFAKPGEPSMTWTGRGRKPNWVVEHLDAGGELKDLEIA